MKKFFKKPAFKIFWLVYALLSILTIFAFADHMLTRDLDEDSAQFQLNNNWSVTINSTTYENVSLDEFKFKPLQKGDSIILENSFPENLNMTNPALTLHIRQTTIRLFCDNKEFYSYGHDRLHAGKTVGSGLQIIDVPQDCSGKEFKIHMTVTEDNAFSSFDPVIFSEWSNSYKLIVNENRFALFSGSFLIVMGLAVSTVTTVAIIYSRKYINILCLGAFSIFIGFWTICYNNLHVLFSIPIYSASLLEYMMLLLSPVPIMGYMFFYVRQLANKKIFVCYNILFGIQTTLSTVSIVLHTTDILHAAALLPYNQIMYVIIASFFAVVFFKSRRINNHQPLLYKLGVLFILIALAYDLGIYVINRYLGLQIYQIKGASSIGFIIFICILILDLVHDMSNAIMKKQEQEQLIQRAYTDQLTQVHNRAFCTEYMEALDNKKSKRYAIVNMDLNNLKIINDTYGHSHGDLLIISAARAFSEAFSSIGIVGRMGGDEFIAIVPSHDRKHIDDAIEEMHRLIDVANSNDSNLNISVSYGIAYSSELKNATTLDVYNLADKRMYEYKKTIKSQGSDI